LNLVVSDAFFPLLEERARYLVLCGGAGSGKSEFAARKLLYRCYREGGHRFLILRKVRSRVRESVLAVFLRVLQDNEIPYDYNKTERVVVVRPHGVKPSELLFDGLDDPEKIKSIKGITGIWLEEATEFTVDDFTQIDLRLRELSPGYHQIVLTFNPDEARAPWLKARFFDNKDPDAFVSKTTVEDNPIQAVRDAYVKRLDALTDPTYRKIYRLGEWSLAKGIIFGWNVDDKPDGQFYEELFYGLDFGFSIDPAALVRVYRRADEFWLEELIYERNLTNPMLADRMKQSGVTRYDYVYADSAEPKSIEELCRASLTVKPCAKGPDSIRAGIDYLKNLKIHILTGSLNLIDEARTYKYKEDKAGNIMPVPEGFKDHLMSAVRYAIHTHCANRIERNIYWL
jgi:phage terminase large subunit